MSRVESKAQTRRALLDSAREVFAEHGFNGAAVEDISERAGFSRGAFYANFADKADVLLTIHESDLLASFEDLRDRLERQTDAVHVITTATAWFEELFESRPLQRAVDEYLPAALRDEAARARLVALDRQIREIVLAAIQAGAGDRTLPIPDEEFALITFAIGNGIARARLLDPDAVRPGLFLDTLIYLWTGIEATGGNPANAISED